MLAENEPTLQHNVATQCWCGENEEFQLAMSDATFDAYVQGYLRVDGVQQPSAEQYAAAAHHCARLKYWEKCWLNYDRHVRISWKSVPMQVIGGTDQALNDWIECLIRSDRRA